MIPVIPRRRDRPRRLARARRPHRRDAHGRRARRRPAGRMARGAHRRTQRDDRGVAARGHRRADRPRLPHDGRARHRRLPARASRPPCSGSPGTRSSRATCRCARGRGRSRRSAGCSAPAGPSGPFVAAAIIAWTGRAEAVFWVLVAACFAVVVRAAAAARPRAGVRRGPARARASARRANRLDGGRGAKRTASPACSGRSARTAGCSPASARASACSPRCARAAWSSCRSGRCRSACPPSRRRS